MWYTYTMEFYLNSNRNEVMFFSGKWIELDIFNLYEISQSDKDKYQTLSVICGS
jgi:hypothetical protein